MVTLLNFLLLKRGKGRILNGSAQAEVKERGHIHLLGHVTLDRKFANISGTLLNNDFKLKGLRIVARLLAEERLRIKKIGRPSHTNTIPFIGCRLTVASIPPDQSSMLSRVVAEVPPGYKKFPAFIFSGYTESLLLTLA